MHPRFGVSCIVAALGLAAEAVMAADPAKPPSSATAVAPVSGAATPAPVQQDLVRGKRLYLQCRACHELGAGAPHKVGPTLHGVFGSKAGTAQGFAFSPALAASGITWTEQSMDAWLARPTDIVPGTPMAFAGIPNANDRRALIAYLAVATR